MDNKTEVLVHITAPSRTADDANYRLFARAIHCFQPAHRTIISSLTFTERHKSEVDTSQVAKDAEESMEHGRGGVINTPMLSFDSVLDNRRSPSLRQGNINISHIQQTQEEQQSWQPPPSVVADSMPYNDITMAEYCTPTRLLEHFLWEVKDAGCAASDPCSEPQLYSIPRQSARGSQESAFRVEPPQETPEHDGWIPDTAPRQISSRVSKKRNLELGFNTETAIPETPVAAPDCEGRRYSARHPDASQVSQDTAVTSSDPGEYVTDSLLERLERSSRSRSEPPQAKRRKYSPHKGTRPSAMRENPPELEPEPWPRITASYMMTDDTEIYAPDPPVSIEYMEPTSLVTEWLAQLVVPLLAKHYKPCMQTRDLRPLERGYWLVDCIFFDKDLRRRFWAFLSTYIGKGHAGWGVGCRRDQQCSWVKVFCWGFVAKHIYLMIYMMSERRVRDTSITWIAADGHTVVVCGGRRHDSATARSSPGFHGHDWGLADKVV